jgi:C4-dicarboxylate-specific signal transduction histidine kinase
MEMLNTSEELGQRLIGEMSNRVRGDVRLEQQREKMASLGKLSAGLAHELNNPATAISSTSHSLNKKLNEYNRLNLNLAENKISLDAINSTSLLLEEISNKKTRDLSALQRSEKEEDITNWLQKKEINDPWELAVALMNCGIQVKDLDDFAEMNFHKSLHHYPLPPP